MSSGDLVAPSRGISVTRWVLLPPELPPDVYGTVLGGTKVVPEPQKCQMTDKLQGEVAFWNGNSFGFIRPDAGDQMIAYVKKGHLSAQSASTH